MASWITITEYRAAPTSVDTDNLVPGGSQDVQDAALAEAISQASAWCDNVANQPLVAAQRVAVKTVFVDVTGRTSFHPDLGPINQLVSLQLGQGLDALVSQTVTYAWAERGQLVCPVSASAGRQLAKITYVSGFGQTVLTGATSAGATSLPVASSAGFSPMVGSQVGTQVTIHDGAETETVTVTGVTSSTVTVSACEFAHAAGAAVSNMPDDLKKAALLATSAFVRDRGSDAAVMAIGQQQNSGQGPDPVGRSMRGTAANMIRPYGRTR